MHSRQATSHRRLFDFWFCQIFLIFSVLCSVDLKLCQPESTESHSGEGPQGMIFNGEDKLQKSISPPPIFNHSRTHILVFASLTAALSARTATVTMSLFYQPNGANEVLKRASGVFWRDH
ncbi:hypothetical protein RRG08_036103 [Elysia crispata]|uniref:Secreted protein n=1 Tax=Elysia crispata TaxID=231223 RepID=A0AAE1E172_9GAST|nr:hypothetical protein RRG08_036103 [Elysia crispata]